MSCWLIQNNDVILSSQLFSRHFIDYAACLIYLKSVAEYCWLKLYTVITDYWTRFQGKLSVSIIMLLAFFLENDEKQSEADRN